MSCMPLSCAPKFAAAFKALSPPGRSSVVDVLSDRRAELSCKVQAVRAGGDSGSRTSVLLRERTRCRRISILHVSGTFFRGDEERGSFACVFPLCYLVAKYPPFRAGESYGADARSSPESEYGFISSIRLVKRSGDASAGPYGEA
ncbi:hypothetical protein B0H19DRAFT_1260611 [Mycena capillaripes]|nr:hypothetical protein B0H19DRAFT_1260611 [Mycena capillaripes]